MILTILIYAYFAFNCFFAGGIYNDNVEDENINKTKFYIYLVLLLLFGTIYFLYSGIRIAIAILSIRKHGLK